MYFPSYTYIFPHFSALFVAISHFYSTFISNYFFYQYPPSKCNLAPAASVLSPTGGSCIAALNFIITNQKENRGVFTRLCNHFFIFYFLFKNIFCKIATRTLTTILLPACLYNCVLLQTACALSNSSSVNPIKRQHSLGVNFRIR